MNQPQPTQEQMEKRAAFLGRSQLHGFVNQLQAGGYTDKNGNNRPFTESEIKSAAAGYTKQMQKRASNAEKIRAAVLSTKPTANAA